MLHSTFVVMTQLFQSRETSDCEAMWALMGSLNLRVDIGWLFKLALHYSICNKKIVSMITHLVPNTKFTLAEPSLTLRHRSIIISHRIVSWSETIYAKKLAPFCKRGGNYILPHFKLIAKIRHSYRVIIFRRFRNTYSAWHGTFLRLHMFWHLWVFVQCQAFY